MNTNLEVQKTEQAITINNSDVAMIIKAELDVQLVTARAFPRSMKQFIDRALSMATLNEDVAASCSYSLPRAGKAIDGPSVRMAEIIVSSFGNIRSGARVIANDGKTITAQGICHDLETNNCVTVEVKRRITGRDGRTFNEDMQVVTGNAACAIAFRNAVFKVVPAALCAEIYEKAKEVAKGTAETLIVRRNKAIEYFHSLKVTDKQICDVLEIKKIEDIDLEKLSTLTGMKAALKNGEATIQSLFETSKEEISFEDLKLLYEQKKDLLDTKTFTEATRILGLLNGKQEKESFKKLHKILSEK